MIMISNVNVYNYYFYDFILDFDNGLYRAYTFYEKVSRHKWIFKFAVIKHLNVHIKVKQKISPTLKCVLFDSGCVFLIIKSIPNNLFISIL